MPLVTLSEILKTTRQGRYAICAINVGNYETIRGVLKAATAERKPVIVQVYDRLFDDTIGEDLGPLVRAMVKSMDVPVALHLDHCKSRANIEKALRAGYTSVMIDASEKPLEENIRITKEVVDLAHKTGVSVEGELGRITSGASGGASSPHTDPLEARRFVSETGVDALAVAIGTAHGRYRETPKLDLDRLSEIAAAVTAPLVLHGGSCTPVEAIKEAVQRGISKINFATEYQELFRDALLAELDPNVFKPVDILMRPIEERLKGFVVERMRLYTNL
jgi:fructose-bisphosphate aldolase, class II